MKTVLRIFIFAVVVFTARQAFSCSCGAITPSDGFDRAQAVFTGTIIKASKSQWTVSVQRVWKGDVQSVVTLRDAHAGTSCASRFLRGASYLFLVNVETDGIRYSPHVCNWTTRLKTYMVRFREDGPSRWTEDRVLMGRGDGRAPLKRST